MKYSTGRHQDRLQASQRRKLFRVGDADRACALLSDALNVEEEIITLSVNRALYGIDLEKGSIAA